MKAFVISSVCLFEGADFLNNPEDSSSMMHIEPEIIDSNLGIYHRLIRSFLSFRCFRIRFIME